MIVTVVVVVTRHGSRVDDDRWGWSSHDDWLSRNDLASADLLHRSDNIVADAVLTEVNNVGDFERTL